MKLVDLEAEFIASTDDGWRRVETFAEAQGIFMLCPKCFVANGGSVGTHGCMTWFANRGVPASARPEPRWEASGSSLDDLTLSPSIQLVGGCNWHGWIRNGEAVE